MLPFVPGLELSGCFHAETVQPLLASRFLGLAYSVARNEELGLRGHHYVDRRPAECGGRRAAALLPR